MNMFLLGIVVVSGAYLQLSASYVSNENRFVEMVLETLATDKEDNKRCYETTKEFFFAHGPFDVDNIVLTVYLQTKSDCKTLGEMLNKIAEGKTASLFGDPEISKIMAHVILAFVSEKRSLKSLYHDPAEMLRRLINRALFSPITIESLPSIDLYKLYHEHTFFDYWALYRYYSAGSFAGTYDLTKISVRWDRGEKIASYLKREAQNNDRVNHICKLFALADDLLKLKRELMIPLVPNRILDSFQGIVSDDLFTMQAQVDFPAEEIGRGSQPLQQNKSQKGMNFFTLPRILMGLGIGFIAGYFIYKHYYTKPKDEVEESIDSEYVLAAAHKKVHI